MKRKIFLLYCLLLWAHFTMAQNVGIDVINPTRAKLELNGGVGRTAAIFGGDVAGISLQKDYPAVGFNQYFDGSGSRFIANGTAAVLWYNPGTGGLYLDGSSAGTANNFTVNSRLLTISPQGNLGLGTGSTNANLQFSNALNRRKIVLYEGANNDYQYYGFGIENGSLRYNVDAAGASHNFYAGLNSGSDRFLMSIQGNKKIRIGEQAAGFFVGINSYDPVYTLEMVEAAGKGLLIVNPDHSYYNWELRVDLYGSTSDALTFYYNQSTTPKGWFRPTDGGYTSNSDLRLKKDIHPLNSVLAKVLQLQPSSYVFKDDRSAQNCLGFIAQDVKKVFPELVDVRSVAGNNTITDLHGINYAGFGVIAIKAIQEQQQQIEMLIKKIELLEQKLQGK